MATSPILVTGASGHLGRRVLELLLEKNVAPLIATTRTPQSLAAFAAKGVDVRAADFDDEASLQKAFHGAKRALLVSTDALDRPGRRVEQHLRAVKAFERVGVEHLAYTSVTNPYAGSPVLIAEDHRQTEAALRASSLRYTLLRNNLYADLLLFSLPAAIASGQLVDARANGSTALVTREDCARIAVAALTDDSNERRTLEVTGPESLTSAQLAAIVSEVTGKSVKHVAVAPEALVRGMVAHGMPEAIAGVYASFDVGIAKGDFAAVSDAVQRLTGSAPQGVRAYLEQHRSAL